MSGCIRMNERPFIPIDTDICERAEDKHNAHKEIYSSYS